VLVVLFAEAAPTKGFYQFNSFIELN